MEIFRGKEKHSYQGHRHAFFFAVRTPSLFRRQDVVHGGVLLFKKKRRSGNEN